MKYPTLKKEHNESSSQFKSLMRDKKLLLKKYLEMEKTTVEYGGNTYSVKEMDALVEEKIEKKYRETLEANAEEIAEERLPQKIDARLNQYYETYPTDCPEKLVNVVENLVSECVDGILNDEALWPQWFKSKQSKLVQDRVKTGLDHEFDKRVKESTQINLKHLKKVEWPTYYKSIIMPNIRNVIADLIAREQVHCRCPRCGEEITMEFSAEGVAKIVHSGWVRVKCPNIGCRKDSKYYLQQVFEELYPQKTEDNILYTGIPIDYKKKHKTYKSRYFDASNPVT